MIASQSEKWNKQYLFIKDSNCGKTYAFYKTCKTDFSIGHKMK